MITAAKRTLRLLDTQVGRPIEDVETPVAMVDLDRLQGNLSSLQSYADRHGIALWPHGKTHKSPEIGALQVALGAAGLTVAKTGEAEVFHEAGIPRLLVHYPTLGREKNDRLAGLVADGLELTIAVDTLRPAEELSAALGRVGGRASVLVELDVGLHRTGQPTARGALALARRVSRLPNVDLAGLSGYPGHCRGDDAERRALLVEADSCFREARDALLDAGLPCARISGGSTPTRYMTHETCVNELRAGTYALLDRATAPPEGGSDACALWVQVTVISDAVPGQVVIDAGTKTLTSDPCSDGKGGGFQANGIVLDYPTARLHALNEEHGYVDVSGVADPPRVGDRLRIVPNHACGCVNLHDALIGVRDGVVDRVINVSARGLVR